jgi:predicted phage tail protein|tara:strand:- start:800 stop:1423 length:624 start_codon:yes stop_codon:yes gene_type:complete
MKVVKVYGALRKRLGRCRFEFEAATPAQALKALCVNFPGLDKWLIDSEKDGVGYRVMVGKERVADDLNVLAMPWSEQEVFSITPVIAGAGGVGRIVLGAALIATAVLVPGLGTTLGTVGIFGSTFGVVSAGIGAIGAGMVLTGVADIISPQPSLDSGLDEAVQLESFTFSNVVNTSKQGLPVPIAYGRVFVGSAVISSGLDVDQKRT